MADIDQTFTAVIENANKQPFKGTARKKQKNQRYLFVYFSYIVNLKCFSFFFKKKCFLAIQLCSSSIFALLFLGMEQNHHLDTIASTSSNQYTIVLS